jgi:hypothetical protein
MISAKRHMARGRVPISSGRLIVQIGETASGSQKSCRFTCIRGDDKASPNPIQHCELDDWPQHRDDTRSQQRSALPDCNDLRRSGQPRHFTTLGAASESLPWLVPIAEAVSRECSVRPSLVIRC